MSFEHLVGQVFRVVKHPNFFKNDLVYAFETDDRKGKDPARVKVLLSSNHHDDRRINAKYLSDPSHFTPFPYALIAPGSRFVTTPEHARARGLVREIITVRGENNATYRSNRLPFYDCTCLREQSQHSAGDGSPLDEERIIGKSFPAVLGLLRLIDPLVYTPLPKASIPKLGRIISRKPRNMIPRVRQSSVRVKNREEIIAGIMAGLKQLPPWDQQEVIFRMMEANRGMGMGMGGFSMLSHCHFEDRRPVSAR